ncbi:MAG: acetate uptake transporter [Candidatus Binataceae bacterium]
MYRPGKVKGIATPIPLGLAAFGATTFLVGFAVIFETRGAWAPYFAQALMFGGVAEFLAGIWSFAYGDALAATTFSFVGVFYGWISMSHMSFVTPAHGAAPALGLFSISTGMVFVVTGFVVLYLWFASFNESATFNATLAAFFIALELFAISLFTGVDIIGLIGGIFALIAGLCAFYGSFAEVYNATTMQEVMPMGEPLAMRERSEHYEYERLRRLHQRSEAMHTPEGEIRP